MTADTPTPGYRSAVTECPTCEGVGEVAKNFGLHSEGHPEIVTCPSCTDGLVPVEVVEPAPNPLGLWGQAPANRTRPALWASVVLPGDRVLWDGSIWTIRAVITDADIDGIPVPVAAFRITEPRLDVMKPNSWVPTSELTLVCHPDMRPDLPAELRGPKEIIR